MRQLVTQEPLVTQLMLRYTPLLLVCERREVARHIGGDDACQRPVTIRERVTDRLDEILHLIRDIITQFTALLDERREGSTFLMARLWSERRGDGHHCDACSDGVGDELLVLRAQAYPRPRPAQRGPCDSTLLRQRTPQRGPWPGVPCVPWAALAAAE